MARAKRPVRNPKAGIAALRRSSAESETALSGRSGRELDLAILDGVGLALYVADMETHELLHVNEEMRRLFGRPLRGGLCYRELQGRDTPCPFCTNDIIKALNGGVYRWEFDNPLINRHALLMDRVIRWPDGRDVRLEVCLDISERRRAEQELQCRDAVLQAVSLAAETLLGSADWSRDMQAVLADLGRAVGVHRAYIFSNRTGPDGRLVMDHAFEWCAPGVTPQIGNPELQGVVYEEACPRWARSLGLGQPVHGPAAAFPDNERLVLEAQGIRSLLAVPIFVAGAWWGFIGFDDCARPRTWSSAETDALTAAAGLVGAAIHRHRMDEELRRSLAAQEALLQEVHHRVKNNLQVVSSLLDLAARRADSASAAEAMQDVRRKVQAMALIHAGIYCGSRLDVVDFGAYAGMLYSHLASCYPEAARRMTAVFSQRSLHLPLAQAVPCALILNEALTNVFRHACPEGREGTVRVTWDLLPDGRVQLAVADQGPGLPQEFPARSKGMGFKLLRGLAEHQLGGRLSLSRGPGLTLAVEFQPEAAATAAPGRKKRPV